MTQAREHRMLLSQGLVLICMFGSLLRGTAGAATPVTTCGQAYSGAGFLTGDLDCTSFGGNSVLIQGGSFDLSGFTLTGGNLAGVQCTKSCRVFSSVPGGLIENSGGVRGGSPGVTVNLTVSDVTLNGNGQGLIASSLGKVIAMNTTISSTTGTAIDADRVKATNVMIMNAGTGIQGGVVKLFDSTLTNAGLGISGSRVVADNSTVTGGNQNGISAGGGVRIVDSTITGNTGIGVNTSFASARIIGSDISGNGQEGISGTSGSLTVKDSTITNNAAAGILYFGRIRVLENSTISGNGLDGVNSGAFPPSLCEVVSIVDSTITGNSLDADCGVIQTCADISTCRLPTVTNTACNTSYDTNSGFPGTNWGVCALD